MTLRERLRQPDEYGFAPHPIAVMPDEVRAVALPAAIQSHARSLNQFKSGKVMEGVLHDLVGLCRAENIPAAFFWIPESPAFRAAYSPSCLDSLAAYRRWPR